MAASEPAWTEEENAYQRSYPQTHRMRIDMVRYETGPLLEVLGVRAAAITIDRSKGDGDV
ncbi:MAG TPA: hypothetical protein PKZ42_03180 [Syntrophales bacterium]|nr:hypothetical protein [Syntrophales bacterium]